MRYRASTTDTVFTVSTTLSGEIPFAHSQPDTKLFVMSLLCSEQRQAAGKCTQAVQHFITNLLNVGSRQMSMQWQA